MHHIQTMKCTSAVHTPYKPYNYPLSQKIHTHTFLNLQSSSFQPETNGTLTVFLSFNAKKNPGKIQNNISFHLLSLNLSHFV